jgi:ketosteroid isomerase-like protein
MFRTTIFAAAFLLSAASSFAATVTPDQKALIDLETAWSKATVDGDARFVAGIMADDWVGQDDSGKPSTKALALADMKKAKFTSMANHDVQVRIMGDVAIVQGADTQKGVDDGHDASGEYTWTDIWMKRDGKWVVVASQDSKVTPQH